MFDHAFLRNNIYCMDNMDDYKPVLANPKLEHFMAKDSYESSVTDCITSFSPNQPFSYPAPIVEAARECDLNYFVWPDGRGFALNPRKMNDILSADLSVKEDGSRSFFIPFICDQATLDTYSSLRLAGVPFVKGGSCVIFSDRYFLILPISPYITEKLRNSSIDMRQDKRKVSGPPSNLRL